MKTLIDREKVMEILNSFSKLSIDSQTKKKVKDEILSLPIEPRQEWIPVSEKLPENWQSIIVNLQPMEEWVEWDIKDARFFSDSLWTRFRVGAWEFVHWMYVMHKEYIQRDTDDILYKVTHWSPLPLPPQ